MKRILDNLLVDLIAAALMVVMVATGYILRFPLPPGTNKSLSLWGLTRHQWGTVHFWVSLGLLVLVIVHVCLHWQWIAISVKRRIWGTASPASSPLVSGLATVLVIAAALALFAWAAQSDVKPIAEPVEGEPNTTTPTSDQDAVAFWSDVYPVFEKSCLSCHGPAKQISGFRVDRRDDYFDDTSRVALVRPGDSERSPLFSILSGRKVGMARADVHRLADNELAIVKAWIDAGADLPDRPAK